MTQDEDIQFLEDFRKKVRDYLFLGYAPRAGWTGEGATKMDEALKNPEFQQLRRDINEMKWRVDQILSGCGVANMIVEYPAPAIGGPVINHSLFDLVTENSTSRPMDVESFTDKIDEAIGVLKHRPQTALPDASTVPQYKITKGFVFIAMPMTSGEAQLEDVHDAIKDVATSIGLVAERVDDPASTDRITDRVLESLQRAEFVIADLTHNKPNVYYEAGYAHALGKTPVYIAREGTVIEFDLKDYPVIFFQNMRQLKAELKKRLRGLLESK